MSAERPLWLAPMWIEEELRDARVKLGAVRRGFELLHDKTSDYARSIEAMLEVRTQIVEALERKLEEVRRA